MRSCVVCRKVRPKRELLRVVRTPDGRIVIDPGGRLSGRGAYVCADGPCRERAAARGALARGLRTNLPPDLGAALVAVSPTTHRSNGGASGQE